MQDTTSDLLVLKFVLAGTKTPLLITFVLRAGGKSGKIPGPTHVFIFLLSRNYSGAFCFDHSSVGADSPTVLAHKEHALAKRGEDDVDGQGKGSP